MEVTSSQAPRASSLARQAKSAGASGKLPPPPPDNFAANHPALLSPLGDLPRTTAVGKNPADPLNVVFVGSRSQLVNAFASGGWRQATRLDFRSAVEMVWKFLTGKPYYNAPVSSASLYGRKEDLTFERENGSTVNQRDHVRFWDTGRKTASGQEIWVGSASHDVGVTWNNANFLAGPTHRISPDVDAERATVARQLTESGVTELNSWQRGAYVSRNGQGEPYYTDGAVAVFQAPASPPSQPAAAGAQSLFQAIQGRFRSLWPTP